ncbi:hypothetical protein CB0940_10610 [Cercospora beticola]|uniref:N-acetyltransferase domain-containing protein n=1 Tax=Cercospora beticola TaxID=122368 RepID=A0A2G5HUU8_CERBT|nr:hypothetical protein CB0940_10610 [Cercospora beticola]PIA96314.1 hypothetical protein CB0940_10610 [Cercospora beticola]WPB07334.1 hypothetical protein RHO25_011995 [Cercospora beticola]
MAQFVLARATPNDMAELVQVQYEAFKPKYVRELFMGCRDTDDLPKLAKKYAEDMAQDPTDLWIKVTDLTTGEIVAASNWRLSLASSNVQPRGIDEPMPWVDGELAAEAKEIMEPMNKTRIENNAEPFIHLHILFTSPEHVRRGIGSMMMRWGCELADLLFIPAWIEASAEGNFLYKRFGFYDQQQLTHKGEVTGTCMRRDARSNAGVVSPANRQEGGIDFGVL